jgi:hypothetical protein
MVGGQRFPWLRRFPAGPTAELLEANLSARPLVCPPPAWYSVLGTASTSAGPAADEARSEALIHRVPPIGCVACELVEEATVIVPHRG